MHAVRSQWFLIPTWRQREQLLNLFVLDLVLNLSLARALGAYGLRGDKVAALQ